MLVVFIIAGFASGSSLVHGATLGVVIAGGVFIVLGYAFYCTAFAAAGSLVSRQSDVNSTIMPVQLPLIIAYTLSYTVIYANGANAFYRVLGFLPPTSPIAMPVLYAAGDVPVWQVVVAAVLCAAGTVWMARIAVKIYSNSILRTGPRISFRQAIKESRNALPGNHHSFCCRKDGHVRLPRPLGQRIVRGRPLFLHRGPDTVPARTKAGRSLLLPGGFAFFRLS
jgi:ABC-type Na+ efflux pump permease subunit